MWHPLAELGRHGDLVVRDEGESRRTPPVDGRDSGNDRLVVAMTVVADSQDEIRVCGCSSERMPEFGVDPHREVVQPCCRDPPPDEDVELSRGERPDGRG
jgi:hypothetical protein